MIILDTNVVSETVKPRPDESVLNWLSEQDPEQFFLCGPCLMEQSYGAERYARKTGSRRFVDHLEDLSKVRFAGRIIEFVDPAPVLAGRIRADRESAGRPMSTPDAMIAAICRAHGATLATRNVRDFEGVGIALVNPFEPAG
ncbi:type II toxin-antitoxin system VapC family toxin [Salmonella enterica subsp. enterica serovar Newport]|nr:type II toxin-antitoxin system VapC family toxin [Salmonella enterica subsp. enterica serovar Newport]